MFECPTHDCPFKCSTLEPIFHTNCMVRNLRVTGFVTMKIGKVAACAVGGGIIMLQIAAHQGYIKIDWDKVMRKAEKITDKVEEKITGEGPNLMDKVRRVSNRCKKFCDF